MNNRFQESLYAIAYRKRSNPLFQTEEKAKFDLVTNTWKYWYADPIVFNYKGREYLFAEQFNRLTGKGSIAVAAAEKTGFTDFKEVLKEAYHLSYPMVFEKDSEIYMIPESTAGQCVKLYRCNEFPDEWTVVTTLFENVLYADTNVVFYQGHYYLITGEMDPKIGSKTKTLIFLADKIEKGVLVPMSGNDSREYSFEERGAGNWITVDGQIVKPTQGGDENSYGKYLVFSSVSESEPVPERKIKRIQTDRIVLNKRKILTGIHTYALSSDFEIIDVKMNQITNPAVILFKIIRKLKKHLNFGG